MDRIGAILREGPAVLRGLVAVEYFTRPSCVVSIVLEMNISVGVR